VSDLGLVTGLTLDGNQLAGPPAAAVTIRDLTPASAVFTPNLLANPGFEDALAHWTEVQANGVEAVVSSGSAHAGSAALELSGGSEDDPGRAAWAADPVPVSAGGRYRVSAWWRSPEGYLAEGSGTAPALQMKLWRKPADHTGLYVQWLDAGGRAIGDPALAVALHLDCASWRLLRREITAPASAAAVRIIVAVKLLGETVRIDDVALVPATEPTVPVTGTTWSCEPPGECIEFAAQPLADISVSMTLRSVGEAIAIHGAVTDTSSAGRALDVTVGFPLQGGGGWTWWDDALTSRPASGGGRLGNIISAVSDGWLPMSLYPYGGLGDPASGLGVALALPADVPQLAAIVFDADTSTLEVTFHLGISPVAVRLGGVATFELTLFRFDPTLGFRDIIARHHDLDPEPFEDHISLYGYEGRSQGQYYSPRGVQQVLDEDTANVYSAQYTMMELPVKVAPADAPQPTLEEIVDVVQSLAESELEVERSFAAAVDTGAVVDTNGDWCLKHVEVPVWNTNWWEADWLANMDPDLPVGLARWNQRWRIDAAFAATQAAGAHLDGVQIDNFMSLAGFDLRPEAIAAADHTLGYSPHTYEPAVHNGFSVFEYLEWLRAHLDAEWGEDRGITINFWGLGHPGYLAPFIDGFGSEGNLRADGTGDNWNLEIINYRRATAYHRPYLFTNQTVGLTAEAARRFAGLAVLYGVVSGPGPNSRDWAPEAEQIVHDAAALVTAFWAYGWEPRTLAHADRPEVLVERFGRPRSRLGPHDPGDVFYTILDTSDEPVTTVLTIDAASLGLDAPATAAVIDLESGQPVPFAANAGKIMLTIDLASHTARVFHLTGGIAAPAPRRARGRATARR